MKTLSILFCRSNLPGSWLIRAFTWSRWSHVCLIDGDNVIEAAWPCVRITTLANVLAKHTAYQIVELPCADPEGALAAAYYQVGKGYDWTALLGFILRRNWQESDCWFCSELVAWAFAQGKTHIFRPKAISRVTPEHLWMLNPVQDQQTTA